MNYKALFFYFRFGNKNLWRRKIRTLLLGISLSVITIIGILFLGYSQGVSKQMIGGAIDNYLGTVLIYDSASKQDVLWPESLSSFYSSKIIKELSSRNELSVRKQYRVKAFTYSANNQQSILIIGAEEKYKNKIQIKIGSNLDGANQILISSKTARNLGVEINDTIACEVVTQDGRRNFDYLQVVGIYQIIGLSDIMSSHMAIATINTVQTLMNESEDMVTELVINKNGRITDESLFSFVNSIVNKKNSSLKVIDWKHYGSILLAIATTNIVSIWVLWGITMAIVAVFLFDTLLSIVEERKKEYGIMMSMGLKLWQMTCIFMGEIMMLSLYFILPGILIGGLLVNVFRKLGIPINNEAIKSIIGGFDKLYPSINTSSLVISFLLLIAFINMVSFFAILKIVKLKPIEVLKNE